MIKTFTLGVLLGLAGSAGLIYSLPAVNLDREQSIIAVQPNGGNREVFFVNLPGDRIMAGKSGTPAAFPAGAQWPGHLDGDNLQAEVFKIRNSDDRVVGVASRIAGSDPQAFVEWAVHLPARGTMYMLMDGDVGESGTRLGGLRAGTREFEERRGPATERFVAAGDDYNDNEGRLEIVTVFVGPQIEVEPDIDDAVAGVFE